MVSVDAIIDRVLSPVFFSIGCFIIFATVFMLGIASSDELLLFSSSGFFIAGSAIFVLYAVDRWVLGSNPEPIRKYTAPRLAQVGEKDGATRSRNKFQAVIEI